MTKDAIIRMAQEAGLTEGQHWNKHNMTTAFMCDFAALVVAAEREACAMVCESLFDLDDSCNEAERCAAAIRARSQS